MSIAGPDLVLHDFSFNGGPVTTNKLHFKELAPGVVEITSMAYSVGTGSFWCAMRRTTTGWASTSTR